MRTPIRTFLFTALVFLGLATGVQAQDKYEFAWIAQYHNSDVRISIEGKPSEKLSLGKEIKDQYDHAKLFNLVSNMQEEGWEVYNATSETGIGILTFILRRKKA